MIGSNVETKKCNKRDCAGNKLVMYNTTVKTEVSVRTVQRTHP